jgi:hypothetical protein
MTKPNFQFLSDAANSELFNKMTELTETGVIYAHDAETLSCCILLIEVLPDGSRRLDSWRITGPTTREEALIDGERIVSTFNSGKASGSPISIN